MIDTHRGWNMSIKPTVLGLFFSLVAIVASYRIVNHYHFSNHVLVWEILILACVQTTLQLIFFLHIGLEARPRWNTLMLLFMIFLMFVLVGGSIWIMHHLDYNVMPPLDQL